MIEVILLRGLPCSGKSTWSKNQRARSAGGQVHRFSADDWFTDPDTGKYNFRPAELSLAHARCRHDFIRLLVGKSSPTLEDGDLVIVDNTNVHTYELAPYYEMATALVPNVKVGILEFHTPLKTCLARNLRRVDEGKVVPTRTILNMQAGLHTEKLPPWWNRRVHGVTA